MRALFITTATKQYSVMNWLELRNNLQQFCRQLWLSICADGWRKFFALLLGFICWYYIHCSFREKDNEWRTLANIPVTLREHSDFYLPRQENLSVDLKIAVESSARRGGVNLDDFRLEINPARLPLTSLEESNYLQRPYKVILNADEHIKQKPAGVKVLRFEPQAVEIYFDRRMQVQKRVYVPVQGRLQEGFDYRYTLSQDTVTVEGPASELAGLPVIYSDSLLLNDSMQHDFSTRLAITSPDSSKFNVFPDNLEVKVTIEDKKSIISQKFPSVKLSLLYPIRGHLRLSSQLPDSVEVILRGQREAMSTIKVEQLNAFLDLTRFTVPGTYDNLPVQFIGLAPGVKPFFIKPDKFAVTLDLEENTGAAPVAPVNRAAEGAGGNGN